MPADHPHSAAPMGPGKHRRRAKTRSASSPTAPAKKEAMTAGSGKVAKSGPGKSHTGTGKQGGASAKLASALKESNPIAFFISLCLVVFALIYFAATLQLYIKNTTELSALKSQEASLIAKKAHLKNEISRWNDTAYITAQARERLGFVYPGEQSITLKNSKHKTASSRSSNDSQSAGQAGSNLPWYKEILYSMQKADSTGPSSSSNSSKSKRIPTQKEQEKWQKSLQNGN